MFELTPTLTNFDFCLFTKMQVVCNMSQKTNQVQHDALKLMHKVPGLGYACPISNIQNAMASSLLEQPDALLLDSAAVRLRGLELYAISNICRNTNVGRVVVVGVFLSKIKKLISCLVRVNEAK